MDILDILVELPVIGDITNLILNLTGAAEEVSFIDKLDGFFNNMGDVFTQIGDLSFNFDQFNGVFEAISKLFGA